MFVNFNVKSFGEFYSSMNILQFSNNLILSPIIVYVKSPCYGALIFIIDDSIL